jgi:hypothetical protein
MARALVVALIGLALLGCRSARAPADTSNGAISQPEPGLADEQQPAELTEVSGFDPPGGEPIFEPGWRLLYRIRLQDGREERSWHVEMRLDGAAEGSHAQRTYSFTLADREETIDSPMLLAEVRLTEEGASKGSSSTTMLPERFLAQGLYDVCRENQGQSALAGTAEQAVERLRRQMGGWLSLVAFLQVVMDNEDLRGVLWTVIQKPSALGVLFGGASVTLSPDFEAVQLEPAGLPPPLDALEAYRLPVHFDVNGTRALDATLLVCPPDPPLHVSAGLIRLEGVHPKHADRRVWIDLVGSRAPAPGANPSSH